MYVYGPRGNDRKGSWNSIVPGHDLESKLSTAEPRFAKRLLGMQESSLTIPRLRKLGELVSSATCIQVEEYPLLEDWVHEHGRLVLIGDAAHPLPVRKLKHGVETMLRGACSQEQINLVL